MTGQNYTKNVTFALYLLHVQSAFTANLASLAFLPSDQQVCPPSVSGLNSSVIAGSYGPWTTTANGSFSIQVSLPRTLKAGEVYAACAISANGASIEPNQSGSVLLFEISVKSTAQSSGITNGSGFFIATLPILGFVFVLVVILIIFFARKQSASPNAALAYAAPAPVDMWQNSFDGNFSTESYRPLDTPIPALLSPGPAPAELPSQDELQIREACAALAQGNLEPVLALTLLAQQERQELWEPLMDAISSMPWTTTPEFIEQMARDAQISAEDQHSTQDALKALVLYSWLLGGTRQNQEIARIQEVMGSIYTTLSHANQSNVTRAIQCYKAALSAAYTEGDRQMYTWLEYELANVYCKLSLGNEPQEDRRSSVLQAINLYNDALRCYESWGHSTESQRVQQSIASAQELLAQLS